MKYKLTEVIECQKIGHILQKKRILQMFQIIKSKIEYYIHYLVHYIEMSTQQLPVSQNNNDLKQSALSPLHLHSQYFLKKAMLSYLDQTREQIRRTQSPSPQIYFQCVNKISKSIDQPKSIIKSHVQNVPIKRRNTFKAFKKEQIIQKEYSPCTKKQYESIIKPKQFKVQKPKSVKFAARQSLEKKFIKIKKQNNEQAIIEICRKAKDIRHKTNLKKQTENTAFQISQLRKYLDIMLLEKAHKPQFTSDYDGSLINVTPPVKHPNKCVVVDCKEDAHIKIQPLFQNKTRSSEQKQNECKSKGMNKSLVILENSAYLQNFENIKWDERIQVTKASEKMLKDSQKNIPRSYSMIQKKPNEQLKRNSFALQQNHGQFPQRKKTDKLRSRTSFVRIQNINMFQEYITNKQGQNALKMHNLSNNHNKNQRKKEFNLSNRISQKKLRKGYRYNLSKMVYPR